MTRGYSDGSRSREDGRDNFVSASNLLKLWEVLEHPCNLDEAAIGYGRIRPFGEE